MLKEPRIQELLDEILDSSRTPEVVCLDNPELLDEVRERLQRVRRVKDQIHCLFPTNYTADRKDHDPIDLECELPRIDGYDVEAVLGRGGMGIVFKARHHTLKRFVALKMMRAGCHADPTERARFQREAEAVAAIRHPNIVEIYDIGDLAGSHYFTMEFLQGGSLAERIDGKPQPVRQAAELVAALASAVQFAHKSGFIHRDLKPSNILFTAGGIPKIADFGLVRSIQIQNGPGFTFSGARIGTPSYMAPEQALGQAQAIGPATDVYALGVILYEMLTGRPPFVADSAAELERQVIHREPASPSRLGTKVPRDLETICLKCLEKSPARRYSSAQDLADDLHRFLDGRPVIARPVGLAQRSVKWARRRPAVATLFAAVLLLVGIAAGSAMWLQSERSSRRSVARYLIGNDIPRAYELGREEQWQDAMRILANSQHNLVFADSDELGGRVARALADLKFAEQLEVIRQSHAMAFAHSGLTSNQACAKEYAEAFAGAQLDVDRVESTVGKIRESELRLQIVAALDRWALIALNAKNEPLQRQLLRIASLADPDPSARADSSEGQGTSGWQDRFRDPDAWHDRQKLVKLADDAAEASTPPPAHQLAFIGILLCNLDATADGGRLLRAALRRRPRDYWLNWEMGDSLYRGKKYQEAVTYFRIALALHPENPWTLAYLSGALERAGQLDEALATGRRALELDPNNATLSCDLASMLLHGRRFDEARAECERILATDPKNAVATLELGLTYALAHRCAEAIDIYLRAIAIDARLVRAWYFLGFARLELGRVDEAAAAFSGAINADSAYSPAHVALAMTSLKQGNHETAVVELTWVLRHLERDRGSVNDDETMDPAALYREAWPALAKSLCCLGRFAEARSAAQQALGVPRADFERTALRRLFDRCTRLAAIEPKLQAVLAGKEWPADVATRRALAEWFHEDQQRPYASARLYYRAFAQQASLLDDLESQDRFQAACAAGLAGCGIGGDASKLDEAVKAKLRKQALSWLNAEQDAWAQRLRSGTGAEQSKAATALAAWRESKDLACLRGQANLARLPGPEANAWRRLWSQVDALVALDPLRQAREYACKKQWAEAVEAYRPLLHGTSGDDSEVWFEFAAARLLAGDVQGYRATCQRMLASAAGELRLRPFLVARACTLAPGSVDDPGLPMRVSSEELNRDDKAFWSLTEQGALLCRAGREREALPLFERSLQAEPNPGCAVLNWLWLALARARLGERAEAQRRLDQAASWLDSLGNEIPTNANRQKMHLHNWLEANVLRKEAELAIGSSRREK